MRIEQAQDIKNSLGAFCKTAAEVLKQLHSFPYKNEAADFHKSSDPQLLDIALPTLSGLVKMLKRYFMTVINDPNPLPEESRLTAQNIRGFVKFINFDKKAGRLLAIDIARMKLEPVKDVITAFSDLGLSTEMRHIQNIYNFALSVKQWRSASSKSPDINLIINIDESEATPKDKENDKEYATFQDFFKSGKVDAEAKRSLLRELKALKVKYDEGDNKAHLVTIAIIIQLYHLRKGLLDGKFETNKKAIFKLLGYDKVPSYGRNAFEPDKKPHLDIAHKAAAMDIIRACNI